MINISCCCCCSLAQSYPTLCNPMDCSNISTKAIFMCDLKNQHLQKESESEVTQSCPTLCDPMDCSLPSSSVHGIFPGKSTGVDCHFLLQRIFPTQGSNPGLPHCRQMLYRLSHQRCNIFREWK